MTLSKIALALSLGFSTFSAFASDDDSGAFMICKEDVAASPVRRSLSFYYLDNDSKASVRDVGVEIYLGTERADVTLGTMTWDSVSAMTFDLDLGVISAWATGKTTVLRNDAFPEVKAKVANSQYTCIWLG